MLFSSIPFLFYFLPVVLLFYFAVPKQLKNAVLLLFSLIFYAWGEPKNVLLMLVAIILSYILGRLIERYAGKWQSKMFLILSIGISLLLLDCSVPSVPKTSKLRHVEVRLSQFTQ